MTSSQAFDGTVKSLLSFLGKLDQAKIFYELRTVRPEAVMVLVTVPGERWEIEFTDAGGIEVEIFRSDGTIAGEEKIADLFAQFSD